MHISIVNAHVISGSIYDFLGYFYSSLVAQRNLACQAYPGTNYIYAFNQANFKSTLSAESLLTNEEAVIVAAASEALALAKAAAKVAKDAALLVKKKPPAEAEYKSHVSSKSDDLLLKWFKQMEEVEDGVAEESMGAGAEIMEGVDVSPSEEESDLEPSHEELERLQEQLSDSIAVRSRRQTERKAKRVRAAEKATTNFASLKPGSSSRRKRVSMQEVDYSDPLRYLRTTTSASRLLTPTEEIKLSAGIQVVGCAISILEQSSVESSMLLMPLIVDIFLKHLIISIKSSQSAC